VPLYNGGFRDRERDPKCRRGGPLNFNEFVGLPPDQQARVTQAIFAGPDDPLFVAIKTAFLREHPACVEADVFCGCASSLGPLNAITVTTNPGVRLRLPKVFLGLPIIRRSPRGKAGWHNW
jgi:hypothetical protein